MELNTWGLLNITDDHAKYLLANKEIAFALRYTKLYNLNRYYLRLSINLKSMLTKINL